MGTIDDQADVSDVVVSVNQEFVDYYFKSKSGKKKFETLIKNIDAEISLESIEPNENALRILGNQTNVEEAMCIIKHSFKFNKPFTHLITIPFIQEKFVQAFEEFKQNLLSRNMDLDEFLFQNPKKLHMTIACLSLETEASVSFAREIFRRECTSFIKKYSNQLDDRIIIKGLDTMNDNLQKTNVLYAQVQSKNLQILANDILQTMASNHLLYNKSDSGSDVKLHLTLMNTSYVRRKMYRLKKRKKTKPLRYFDATQILQEFGDHLFCEIDIPPIQLNELHKTNEFGYYNVLESIELNSKI